MRLIDVIEVLYEVRQAIEGAEVRKRGAALAVDCLRRAEHILVANIRNVGCDPGRTALDADALKLAILRDRGVDR